MAVGRTGVLTGDRIKEGFFSLRNRHFMSQARRTRHFARSAKRVLHLFRAPRKMSRSPRLDHEAPVMQARFFYRKIYDRYAGQKKWP